MRSLACFANVTFALAFTLQSCARVDRPGTQAGAVAPELVGEDLDGIPLQLSAFRGKVVLLDFWGDW